MERTGARKAPRGGTARRHRFWLLLEEGRPLEEALCLGLPGGGEVLAVFSHREEAELFSWLAGLGGRWRARESSAGEVVSLLCGPFVGTEGVALDPVAGMLGEGLLPLVTVRRERFAERLASGPARRRLMPASPG